MIIQIIIIVKIINKGSHSLAKVIAFQKSKYPTFYLLYKKMDDIINTNLIIIFNCL